MAKPGSRLALHHRILIGLVAGLVMGVGLNASGGAIQSVTASNDGLATVANFVVRLNGFVGDLFLRALRLIAVPIVLFSLIVGASSLSDTSRLGRIGAKTIGLYLGTTAIAIITGLLFANILQPGSYVPEAVRNGLAEAGGAAAAAKLERATAPDVWDTLLEIVPSNPFASLANGNMLQVVFAGLVVGLALTRIPPEKAKPVIAISDAMTDVTIKMIDVMMQAAPYAVFALMVDVVATLGIDVLGALAVYSICVVAGLAVMMFGVYPLLVRVFARLPAKLFFKSIAPAQLLAFSSSSSSATLPVTLECVEERLGVSDEVTSFVVPLGSTINMDGTALYQGVAAVFIAQLYGIDLTLGNQLTIVLTATLSSIGAAGVPGIGLVMLVIVLQSVGISPEVMAGGIAVILGVDRILDMCRTATNVTGDCMVAAVVARGEGHLNLPTAADGSD